MRSEAPADTGGRPRRPPGSARKLGQGAQVVGGATAGDGEVAATGPADADVDADGKAPADGELLAVADGEGAATIGMGGGKCVAV